MTFDDPNTNEVEALDEHTIRLVVQGEAQSSSDTNAGGCVATSGEGNWTDLAMIMFVGVGLLGLRRRRI